MNKIPTPIQPPNANEKRALRLMIFVGLASIVFFLYSMLQKDNISYFPLYILLMITVVYYSLKYLHEWYHYFSISADKKPVTDKIYTVDILTTYCAGEPFDMLEQTLTAIQHITYPHTAWCCDEADDPAIKQLCTRLGVQHVTRIIKKDAKAGNINNALQYATGELCVVLDPDHIPVPEFLDRVVAYFDDPAIGFVQVVQAYYNQSESLVAKGAAQQTYQFYGPMMMAMHTYGTVQAIGANCTFRRAAIDSIGGHASGLSEDMHTAMQMHAKGWRSIYVPEILTRGLVPATMSSYFKQQLKWSRGTWELLVTAYPKLFTKFTWRQKIHYATLPFHYLSGFIFLFNFLIPVISLFTGNIPLQMDIVSFLLAAFPMFSMGILIRHYVQKWVAEESDRGFHLVGGILQIGTWWIHSVGFIYTILRKKVPYIPTPKNDNDPLPLILNLPNILVAVISLIAIFYGLWYDYTPYTAFMVILASMQIFFMVFILSISGYTTDTSKASSIAMKLRQNTWLIKKSHGFLRKFSLPLSFLVIITFVFFYNNQQQLPTFLPKSMSGLNVFYPGLYLQTAVGNDRMNSPVFSISDERKDISIIAYDLPWGQGEKNVLDTLLLQKMYSHNTVPMLVWNLWQKDSISTASADTAVLEQIMQGKYDAPIIQLAVQLAAINKPVFLQCGNQSVQNKLPLFAQQNAKHANFIAAWQYVHRLFDKSGADKIIWIWNPIDIASAVHFFPGKQYVDWLSIDISSPSIKDEAARKFSFDSLYRPDHLLPIFKSGLPIMVTNKQGYAPQSVKWWVTTWNNIDTSFSEIKCLIAGSGASTANKQLIVSALKITLADAPDLSIPLLPKSLKLPAVGAITGVNKLPVVLKSIVYDKGFYWFRNRHTMGQKTLEADVAAIKEIGINTIERTMPGFYDIKLGEILVKNQMNLIPRFWLLATPEVVADDRQLQQQKEKILSVVKANLNKKNIIAWSLGEDVLFSLDNQLYKPAYFYYQQKYVAWLADVTREIRLLDTYRPIIMDLQWDEKGRTRFQYYKQHVPLINQYMLVADVKYKQGLAEPLEDGMAWGRVAVELWPLVPAIRQSGTIPAWQDIENTDFVTINGLLDLSGRKKEWYRDVKRFWGGTPTDPSPIPEIRILKPASYTNENTELLYHVMYRQNKSLWRIYQDGVKGINFEWYLVRTDQYGNTMFIKKVGEGATIALTMPKDPQYYQLYVEAIVGRDVKMASSTLNTPLE
jgi:cellulose synthase/poly-beta-1,6-N-acetylglucosamine synthase-like glycosyltransferase